jgi:hypothetical protein
MEYFFFLKRDVRKERRKGSEIVVITFVDISE